MPRKIDLSKIKMTDPERREYDYWRAIIENFKSRQYEFQARGRLDLYEDKLKDLKDSFNHCCIVKIKDRLEKEENKKESLDNIILKRLNIRKN
jgi:hypothetical protein